MVVAGPSSVPLHDPTQVQALRAHFCEKGIRAAQHALEMVRRHAGDPIAQERNCFYVRQAMEICYYYAQAWQVVVDCALEAHEEMLLTGRWAQWASYLELALDASRHLHDVHAEMRLLLHLGRMRERCGEWAVARTHFEQVTVLASQSHDRIAHGLALTALANMERQSGRLNQAQQWIARALELLADTDDARALSETYRGLGNLELQRGKHTEALRAYSKALEYAQAGQDLRCLASIYHNLGTMCAQQGESRGAAAQYDRALQLFRQVGDTVGEVMTLSNIGLACQADRGYWRQAIATFQQSIALAQQVGYYQGEVTALGYLVDTCLKLGEVHQAAAAIERLRALFTRTESAYDLAILERSEGLVCLACGEVEAALEHLQRARASPELADDWEEIAQIETALGRVYARLGDGEKAEAAYRQALAAWSNTAELPGELETWLDLVELERQQAAWEKLEEISKPARLLAQRIEREDALARLEIALGDIRFAAGCLEAGCEAYARAMRRVTSNGENDRQAQCGRYITEQVQAQINTPERVAHFEWAMTQPLE